VQEGQKTEKDEMMRSWDVVLEILRENGPMTPKDIMKEADKRTDFHSRTVSWALRRLIKLGKVRKSKPVQLDQRQPLYHIVE